MATRDPYDILGLSRSASEAEIKKAYRRLAKTHHPDQNKDDPKASGRFAEIGQAYEILGDPEKRRQFDRGEIDAEGKPRFRGFEGFGAGDDFAGSPFRGRTGGARGPAGGEDIFAHIFGDAFRQAETRARSTRGAQAPEEAQTTLSVTLDEIAAGAPKRITTPTGREVQVSVPKGVTDGQVIRLRGLGLPGIGGAGDLMLTIRILPDARFTPEGSTLRHRLPLALDDAILGATVRVPTLTGAVEMTVPPMTNSGRTFRLRGKGLPGKEGPGDLMVTVELQLPQGSDEALTAFARSLRVAKTAA